MKLRVSTFSISLDGYGAGPNQTIKEPLGAGGEALHDWVVATRAFKQMGKSPKPGGTTGVDNDFVAGGMEGLGAWILGRNMFGPVRGPWPDQSWRGWWGEDPPYHVPVFVLTHHPRPPLEMKGGTTFYFVTDGIHAALQRAREAAGDLDVRIGGGVSTIRQYLQTRLLDEMHLAIAPLLLGGGEHLLSGLDLPGLGYACDRVVAGEQATHLLISRRA